MSILISSTVNLCVLHWVCELVLRTDHGLVGEHADDVDVSGEENLPVFQLIHPVLVEKQTEVLVERSRVREESRGHHYVAHQSETNTLVFTDGMEFVMSSWHHHSFHGPIEVDLLDNFQSRTTAEAHVYSDYGAHAHQSLYESIDSVPDDRSTIRHSICG